MEVVLGTKEVSLVGLTYEEAEVLCKALDEFRFSDRWPSRYSNRCEALCAGDMYIELDEALHPIDEDCW